MTDKRNLVVEDLVRINSIEDPRFSPDGQWIAFVRVQIDREKNAYLRNIWLAAADGSRLFPLTRSGKDTQPRWAPDGRQIAFSSSRADKQQIYVQAIDQGGDPRKLTSAMNGANTPCWSPDGTQIAFLASVSADDCAYEDDPENAGKPGEEDEKKKSDPASSGRCPTGPERPSTPTSTPRFM
ncbi:MAG: PD40 domain-containing protein [Chloroflexi bacterium]|nr:PD40 domain-containing protein [Chloroflexota bacterium]